MKSPNTGLFIVTGRFEATGHCYSRTTPASCRTPIDSITIINAAANMRYAATPFELDFESVTAHSFVIF